MCDVTADYCCNIPYHCYVMLLPRYYSVLSNWRICSRISATRGRYECMSQAMSSLAIFIHLLTYNPFSSVTVLKEVSKCNVTL